ncbi:MAG: creatininase family protein [Gemmatimonadaceae bacterium]|nr:creatininase family protein [Gemmatimonadaceae bacterium]
MFRTLLPLPLLLIGLATGVASPASGQGILRWADLSAAQVARLDRTRTAVLLPAGIIEEHGPLLPNGAEITYNERLTADLAAAIAARPGWTVVVLPTLPIGSGAFDRRAGRAGYSGSLPVRASTMQVFTDYADNLGQQGFRHVFVINGHADANHDRALDRAGDYFGAAYRGFMIHLLGRRGCHPDGLEPPPLTLSSASAMTADADSPHGGTMETSRSWWLRPDLVDSVRVRRAEDRPAKGAAGWASTARQADWAGYVGAPRFATLELGAWLYDTGRQRCTELALRFLDGLDEATVPRYGDQMRAYPDVRLMLEAQEREEAEDAAHQKRVLSRLPQR